MVKVTVNSRDSLIQEIEIKGHANSVKNEAQLDLVCAQVSAVSVGTLNAIEELCGEQSCIITMKSGYVQILVKESSSTLQTILKTLRIQLESIEFVNKKYIKIRKAEV